MKTAARSDEAIHQAVLREFKCDPRVEDAHIQIEVRDGVVILTGRVTSYPKRMVAQDAAHRVSGVLDVANDLQVRLPGSSVRTDSDIAQAVRKAMESHVEIPHERIQSTVSDGWVTLEGSVDYWYQREEATSAVRNLVGVCGVTDRISVGIEEVGVEDVKGMVGEALQRRAERAAGHIDVKAQGGTVRLEGPVQSWTERRAIVGAVKQSPKVRAVIDRLHVDPLL